ncbi:Clavaminate synthase-like protein [Massarina eburnea CBS 473.64]|uniref:Clavaminate synthase-like protein n=1 Tax=Massarina eburnea CBS 473.64 TaxID=1395130 RepID=A0A6A6SB42_9PLEO|nr:Clavaminate synthase-like protein [Massarina eburnea CBS 473.64]
MRRIVRNGGNHLITTYHSLNPPTITELSEDPSPLEFMRHVSLNRPFIIRNGARDWKALQRWNANYLCTVMEGQTVNVATTPLGNADSVIHLPSSPSSPRGKDEKAIFVKPHETTSPFTTALQQIQAQELHPETHSSSPTHYLQTQNDNLRNEYTSLFTDVPQSIPFARIALNQDPDAINFWLGNSSSTTALHKDNYENIYVQVTGKKHFVLLPPVEAACVNEKAVLAATYTPRPTTTTSDSSGTGVTTLDPDLRTTHLVIRVDDPNQYIPFATWDPDTPSHNPTPYSHLSRPLRVTLNEGDMLYLPALWYHKVSQSCSDEGICCAVNYWYDVDFAGGFWSMANFVRGREGGTERRRRNDKRRKMER